MPSSTAVQGPPPTNWNACRERKISAENSLHANFEICINEACSHLKANCINKDNSSNNHNKMGMYDLACQILGKACWEILLCTGRNGSPPPANRRKMLRSEDSYNSTSDVERLDLGKDTDDGKGTLIYYHVEIRAIASSADILDLEMSFLNHNKDDMEFHSRVVNSRFADQVEFFDLNPDSLKQIVKSHTQNSSRSKKNTTSAALKHESGASTGSWRRDYGDEQTHGRRATYDTRDKGGRGYWPGKSYSHPPPPPLSATQGGRGMHAYARMGHPQRRNPPHSARMGNSTSALSAESDGRAYSRMTYNAPPGRFAPARAETIFQSNPVSTGGWRQKGYPGNSSNNAAATGQLYDPEHPYMAVGREMRMQHDRGPSFVRCYCSYERPHTSRTVPAYGGGYEKGYSHDNNGISLMYKKHRENV